MSKPYCFCTLAIGKRYRLHAQMLAEDLQRYAPGIDFVVFTDKPQKFLHLANVRAFSHRLQSVRGLHDKRFVLEKSLALFESCIFVDADIRVLGPVPEELPFRPGLVARYGCGIIKHNTDSERRNCVSYSTIQEVASTLNLDLEKVSWFHEFSFLLSRQQGKEKDFFRYWDKVARYFEMRGIYHGVGNIVGLAAAASELDLTFYRSDFFPCFKDNIQKEKIKKGQADPDVMADEFRIHREIEYPQRSLAQKITDKIQTKTGFYHRLTRLRLSHYLNASQKLKA